MAKRDESLWTDADVEPGPYPRRRFAVDLRNGPPSHWIDYPAETGVKGRQWPKELCVGRNGLGRLAYLLRAIGEGEYVNNLRVPAIPSGSDALPGYRVLGRLNIAKHLGVRPEAVTAGVKRDPLWRRHIHKVGWLLVSTVGDLDELDIYRQRNDSVKRSRASKGG